MGARYSGSAFDFADRRLYLVGQLIFERKSE